MAILKGETTIIASEEDVVFSEDPDVTPDAEHADCGWIPVAHAQVRKGADVVKIAALGPGNRGLYRGTIERQGTPEANRFACHRGVLKVNGKNGKAVTAFVDALAQQDAIALDLLADRINQLSMGAAMEPIYEKARLFLRLYRGDAPKEVADEAASKSAAR